MNFKKMSATVLVGLLVGTSAIAQNNNTGQIVVQGAVPGTWELTVFDINPGYDFDLSDNSGALTARVGTIHVYTNNASSAGGHLFIESANAGRLINNETIPGIAAEHQVYTLELKDNALVTNGLTVNASSTLTPDSGTPYDLLVPATIDFDTAGAVAEGTYDVEVTIPGTDRPQASGVYSDTITFTIMDDN